MLSTVQLETGEFSTYKYKKCVSMNNASENVFADAYVFFSLKSPAMQPRVLETVFPSTAGEART